MADYGSVGGGRSLRDALNEIMPLTGMGEYGAMFPPNAGAPEPTAPVPLPQSRPPLPGYPPPQQVLTRPPLPGGPVPQQGLTRPPLPGGAPQPGLSRPPLPQQGGLSPDLARLLMDLAGPGISPAGANPALSTGQIANSWGIPASLDQAVSGQYPLGMAAVGRAIR